MRGPIDFIIVGFTGNKFDGSILKAIGDAIDKKIIDLVALAVISKDKKGKVTVLDLAKSSKGYLLEFATKYKASSSKIGKDDIDELDDLLENDTAAGLLVIEHLWAKPLKKALLDANGVLVAEGRIHPGAASELSKKGA